MLSVRAYDSNDMLRQGAAVIGTAEIDQSIQEFLADCPSGVSSRALCWPGLFRLPHRSCLNVNLWREPRTDLG